MTHLRTAHQLVHITIQILMRIKKSLATVCLCTGAPWATTTKNVKKPPGEKGRTFRKSKMLFGVQETFLIF